MKLIEELPEAELQAAERFLAFLRSQADPLVAALAAAPVDDEPETEEERLAVAEAREAIARGDVVSDEELWRRLGHEQAS